MSKNCIKKNQVLYILARDGPDFSHDGIQHKKFRSFLLHKDWQVISLQKKLILLLGVFSLLLAAVYYIPRGYQQTIVIGMYAECPLEAAEEIAGFHAEHPNASLKLANGINKADYNEWLAQGFLSGNEPDVFVVPPEDLEKYIQLGALQDLSLLLNQHAPGTEAAKAPFYTLTLNTPRGDILMSISARAKYPKLTFELLKTFQK